MVDDRCGRCLPHMRPQNASSRWSLTSASISAGIESFDEFLASLPILGRMRHSSTTWSIRSICNGGFEVFRYARHFEVDCRPRDEKTLHVMRRRSSRCLRSKITTGPHFHGSFPKAVRLCRSCAFSCWLATGIPASMRTLAVERPVLHVAKDTTIID